MKGKSEEDSTSAIDLMEFKKEVLQCKLKGLLPTGWHSSLATQKNKNNIVVTIHTPDKTRIRSRHALLTYCTENNVDISQFGDLRFFYNPNYLPAVEPHAMERSLKRLEMKKSNAKRKMSDSIRSIHEPSAKRDKKCEPTNKHSECHEDENSKDNEPYTNEISNDQLSRDEISRDDVSGDEISTEEPSVIEILDDNLASGGEMYRDEFSRNELSSDQSFGDEISGDEISLDEAFQSETSGNEVSGDEISMDEAFQSETSGDETSGDEQQSRVESSRHEECLDPESDLSENDSGLDLDYQDIEIDEIESVEATAYDEGNEECCDIFEDTNEEYESQELQSEGSEFQKEPLEFHEDISEFHEEPSEFYEEAFEYQEVQECQEEISELHLEASDFQDEIPEYYPEDLELQQETLYFQQEISEEIPESYNEIPIKEDDSFVCGGYNWPSLDENGQIYWPKSVVKHVGLENLPSDNFEISIGPFGKKRIVSQQEMEKQHKFAVEKEWLKSPSPKLTAQKSENLIFTNSNEYLKVRPCANHHKNDEKNILNFAYIGRKLSGEQDLFESKSAISHP